ncbi:MAG: TonB family protein [Paracoccus sp. (in: a-proteobacteria)]|nr:TonB family protein [Paracoccus sp. (in: a-proteobacteria)]
MLGSTVEKLGFLAIAAALHVAAAALIQSTDAAPGEALQSPPAELAAGGAEIEAMVAEWEAPPEIPQEIAFDAPEPQAAEMVAPLEPPAMPEPSMVVAALPALAPPAIAEARPNLPEAPEEPVSELLLEASERPAARPERRREPAPQRQQTRNEPRQQQPARRQQAAPSSAGQAGQQQSAPRSQTGGGGLSGQQAAQIEANWRQQVRTCIARAAGGVRGGRGQQLMVNFVMGRNGRVQGASIAASSGDARVDQRVAQAIQRANCPAAPASMPGGSFSFSQPFTVR